jgi:hypothetical protein
LRPGVAVFGGRQGVRTEDGKFVAGMGFAAWRKGQAVIVAVIVLVSDDDRRIANHADYELLSHRHLINYELKAGEVLEVKEAASLGFGTTTVALVSRLGV